MASRLPPAALLARDAAVFLLTVMAWWLDDRLRATAGPWALAVGALAGVLAAGLDDIDSARKYLSALAELDFGYRDVAQRLDKLTPAKDKGAGK